MLFVNSGEPTTGEATVGPGLESVCLLIGNPIEDLPEVKLKNIDVKRLL